MRVESRHMSFITSNFRINDTKHWYYAYCDHLCHSTALLSSSFHICRGRHCGGDVLQGCGISEGSTVFFSLSTFSAETSYEETFFINDVVPSVQQSQKGISVFLSSLFALVSFMFYVVNTLSVCTVLTHTCQHAKLRMIMELINSVKWQHVSIVIMSMSGS